MHANASRNGPYPLYRAFLSILLWAGSLVVRFWLLRTLVLSITSNAARQGYSLTERQKPGGFYDDESSR